jgi:mannosyltransferase OCH1-like enzyme
MTNVNNYKLSVIIIMTDNLLQTEIPKNTLPKNTIPKNTIPLNIFQTWHTKKTIPLNMFNAINDIKTQNPEFKHFLFDDNDCRNFIKTHFKPEVLHAYDSLIPGAYKADLWRYCVLFIVGGIYIDIKFKMTNQFKLIHLIKDEHFVLDANKKGLYNAFMICRPGNELLFKAINMIVQNVKHKFYGNSFLEPTGPKLLAQIISLNDSRVDMRHLELEHNNNKKVIIFDNKIILNSYYGHINDRIKSSKTSHYSTLWKEKKVYKK